MTSARSLLLPLSIAVLASSCTQEHSGLTSPSVVTSSSSGHLTADAAVAQSRPAERCVNVFAEGAAQLAFVEVAPGVFTLGAIPEPVTFGGITGLFGSVVTSLTASGSGGQGAQHFTLRHTFVSTDPAGSFVTADRAVCAPAGGDPNVCRVNDVLEIVSGTGVFTNANGMVQNHGVVDLNTNILTFSVRGRVCGDGL